MTQLAILILSGSAFALLQTKRASTRRLACVLGIVAQAFWLHATWSASQWGMFGLALLYGVVYLRELVALHH